MTQSCTICPHHCVLSDGQTGLCKARKNVAGKIISINYGKVTALALDPIEKKPLRHFFPGSNILSVGSFGCNMRCDFCQNYSISTVGETSARYKEYLPEDLVALAKDMEAGGNIGLAYTYNEPLVGYEFVRDCSKLIIEQGLKNVLVTNGLMCSEPFGTLLPYIDAVNIDLKCFNPTYYKKLGGDFETVKSTIESSMGFCHVEITSLIVPGENDSEEEMEALVVWLASLDSKTALHISRFYPNYLAVHKPPTPVEKMKKLCNIAKSHLEYVYLGNV